MAFSVEKVKYQVPAMLNLTDWQAMVYGTSFACPFDDGGTDPECIAPDQFTCPRD